MEAELVQLAREAVVALQASSSMSWGEVTQICVSIFGLGGIFWGLGQMQAAGRRRDKEIDEMAATMRESTRVVGQALERQNEMMTEALQGLRQQGEVLAELLRRRE